MKNEELAALSRCKVILHSSFFIHHFSFPYSIELKPVFRTDPGIGIAFYIREAGKIKEPTKPG